jgi:hypothetical protein
MFSRMYAVGVLAIFGLGLVLIPDETLGRPVGSGGRAFSISSGLHHSMFRPISAQLAPLSFNRREFAARVPPRKVFGFGFTEGLFGFDFPVTPFGFAFPAGQLQFTAVQTVLGNCSSFYCTYYDPSHLTYVDPYRWPASRDLGLVTGAISGGTTPITYRRGCDTETVTVPLGDDKESSINIVRC